MRSDYEVYAAKLKQQFIDEGHLDWLCKDCGEPIAKQPTPAMIHNGLCQNCLTQIIRIDDHLRAEKLLCPTQP